MISLCSSGYKKEDFKAWDDILNLYLKQFIYCPKQGTNCSSCYYKKPCRDLSDFYNYIQKKIN